MKPPDAGRGGPEVKNDRVARVFSFGWKNPLFLAILGFKPSCFLP